MAERSFEDELAAVHDHAMLLKSLGAKVMVYGGCGSMPGLTPLNLSPFAFNQ